MVFLNDNLIEIIPDEFSKKEGRISALSLNDNPISVTEREKTKKYFRRFWLLEL